MFIENSHSLPIPTALIQTDSNNYRKSYAAATERDSFPSKDQAIVIESKQDIPLADYTTEVGKLVGPTNIRYASKISNARECVYLASKKVVENLTEKHGNIRIREHILELQSLITKYKKLILSNVCPIIPHSVIITALNNIDVVTPSQLIFLRAGISEPGFTHILSFRRQVYIPGV